MADQFGGKIEASFPYHTTLTEDEEKAFQKWVAQNNVPFDSGPHNDYDMRGFFRAQRNGDPRAVTDTSEVDGRLHFTDAFKTPYHKSFSNESIYAGPNAPRWVGNTLQNPFGETIFVELPQGKPVFTPLGAGRK